MTAQEMHIEIDLDLQKLNSSINKNLLPQEKDWFLNREVTKFINQRLDKHSNRKQTGFAETSKRVDDLRELVRVQTLVVNKNDRGESYAAFPSNYLRYIRFDDYLKKECTNSTKNILKETTTKYSVTGELNLPTNTLGVYTISLRTGDILQTLFRSEDLPTNYIIDGNFSKQSFLLRKAIYIKMEQRLKELLSPNTHLYWDNLTSFTITSDVNFDSINIFNNEDTNTSGNTYVFDSNEYQERQYNTKDLPLKSRVRLVNNEFLTDIENSSISKSIPQSPVGTIREDKLILSKCESAIHGKVDITYICKPTLIDIYLNSNLNMSRSNCEEIVSNTIRFIKAILQDPNYKTYAQENILIE